RVENDDCVVAGESAGGFAVGVATQHDGPLPAAGTGHGLQKPPGHGQYRDEHGDDGGNPDDCDQRGAIAHRQASEVHPRDGRDLPERSHAYLTAKACTTLRVRARQAGAAALRTAAAMASPAPISITS